MNNTDLHPGDVVALPESADEHCTAVVLANTSRDHLGHVTDEPLWLVLDCSDDQAMVGVSDFPLVDGCELIGFLPSALELVEAPDVPPNPSAAQRYARELLIARIIGDYRAGGMTTAAVTERAVA